jgi:hypothetical protein
MGVSYSNEASAESGKAGVKIGDDVIEIAGLTGRLSAADYKKVQGEVGARLKESLTKAGYPAKADMEAFNYPMVIVLLTILVLYVTMVYGPIAAWLVELFPARIRYTSMSLPYHIGNGWFGGFLPVTSFAIVAATGNIYNGLWYPIVVALMTLVVGGLFLRETRGSSPCTTSPCPSAQHDRSGNGTVLFSLNGRSRRRTVPNSDHSRNPHTPAHKCTAGESVAPSRPSGLAQTTSSEEWSHEVTDSTRRRRAVLCPPVRRRRAERAPE